MRQFLYRNAEARDHLELFLVAAVSSMLLLRFLLHLSGYPQVGGGSLHIAHMLYGGLLMMASIAINLSFLGIRAQRLSALVGGVGFGVFIDELGKFLTRDNNYFFRPTIGLIYAIFVVLFLIFNFISRIQKLSSEEYQLNALQQFEEAVVHDMDRFERAKMHRFLQKADPKSPITKELHRLLERAEIVRADKSGLERIRHRIAVAYRYFWQRRESSRLVGAIFITEAVVFLLAVSATLYNNFDDLSALLNSTDSYATRLIIGQVVASLVAGGFALAGAFKLTTSRPEAYVLFRRALLINILLTEFFIFSRIQFGAIPGFLVNLGLLAAVRFAEYEEKHAKF